MSKHLINYVQFYINPQYESSTKGLADLSETIVFSGIMRIVLFYGTLSGLTGPEYALDLALRTIFCKSLLEESKTYTPQFMSLENTILMCIIEVSKKEDFQIESLMFLSETITRVIELFLIQTSELFFLCNGDTSQFWNELTKDPVLSPVVKNLSLNETVFFRGQQRGALTRDFEIPRNAEKEVFTLIDSFVVALTRSRFL